MVLSPAQQTAVVNGEMVTLNVGGTECVLVRKDIFLQLDPEFDSGPWTENEIDLLADEVHDIISRSEAHGH